ncbi:MAG: pantoate--beta-alanine ligase [Acidobacteriota bacterium]
MMEIITAITEIGDRVREIRAQGRTIGFVPTMGALHPGHLSLVEKARADNDIVIVSIFVNPTQFNDKGDLEHYPRTFESDRRLLQEARTDILFFPEADGLYRDEFRFKVTESPLSEELEGAHRSGHFDGVLTVVMKLLSLIRPDRAYFGEKDWQQFILVRDMAAAFFLETEIVPCPVIREPDGLAMSSRNTRLSAEERRRAAYFSEVLRGRGTTDEKKRALKDAGFEVDYLEERDGRTLGAVVLGRVRLIDNVKLSETEKLHEIVFGHR